MAGEKLTPDQAVTHNEEEAREAGAATTDGQPEQPNRHGGSPAAEAEPRGRTFHHVANTNPPQGGPAGGGPVGAPPRAVRPLLRVRVKNRLKERLAEVKVGKGKAAKALPAAKQEQLVKSVDNDAIDAAYDMAVSEGASELAEGAVGGPFIDRIIASGLIEKIVEILLKLLTG